MSAAAWPALAPATPLPADNNLTVSRSHPAAAQPTEAELIDGCLQGRQLAQKQLYDRYAARMMAVCLRYAQTTFEAEDVLQEGFLTVFRTLGSFRRECPLEFWIRRIMVNAALRQHRRNAPLVAVSDGDYPELLASEEFTFSNYAYGELLAVVQELAPRYRLVFNLYAIEGYTHKRNRRDAEYLGRHQQIAVLPRPRGAPNQACPPSNLPLSNYQSTTHELPHPRPRVVWKTCFATTCWKARAAAVPPRAARVGAAGQ